MRRFGLWWFWLLLLLPGTARAATVAVLPLAPTTGSEISAGLGDALATLLGIDLGRLPDVEVVLPPHDSDSLSTARARRLARRHHVDWLVSGTYTLVGGRLGLAIRATGADAGQRTGAVEAWGAVGDFAAVQKAALQGLLDRLGIALAPSDRRQLMIEAPTESFVALKAFGEGLELAHRGDTEAARAAHERAVGADPGFGEANAALARLDVAPPRPVGATPADLLHRLPADPTEPARVAIRIELLRDEGRHCERADEMRAFLSHHGRASAGTATGATLSVEVSRLAGALGAESRVRAFEASSQIFSSVGAFAFDRSYQPFADDLRGLAASMEACLGPERMLDELDGLIATLREGLAGPVSPHDSLSWRDAADVTWALVHARHQGLGQDLDKRLARLRARYPAGSPGATRVLGLTQTIRGIANERAAVRRRRLGHSESELVRLTAGLLGRDLRIVALDSPYCRYMADHAETNVGSALAERDPATGARPSHAVDRLAAQVGPLADFGCLRGVRPRFTDVHGAWRALRAAVDPGPTDATASCRRSLAQARELELDVTLIERLPASYRGFNGWLASLTYWNLVRTGCLPWD
ncbi:MAG: hypothetical protein AAF602_00900 [Myxococcota bacterium]